MKLRISGLLAVAAFAVAGLFGSAQTLAQNAYIPSFTDNKTVSVLSTGSLAHQCSAFALFSKTQSRETR
jgi:hypothetical protein